MLEDGPIQTEATDFPIRSNAPVVDLAAALNPEMLQVWLDYQYLEHKAQRDKFNAMLERFNSKTSAGIQDDVVSGLATDAVRSVTDEISALDKTHEVIKKPVLHAQRMIDGDAKRIKDDLQIVSGAILAKQTVYLTAKADRLRKEAEEEAARKELEAQELMRQEHTSDDVIAVISESQAAAELASAPSAQLVKSRSGSGAIGGLKDNWQYRVVDISKIPSAYLTVNDAMVKAAMKSAAKNVASLKIDGIEIFNDMKAYVR